MKYMGSKARLAKELAPIINAMIDENNITTYIEPFVGGANMIQHIECEKRVGSDNNHYLIAMWNAILKGWVPPSEISKQVYKTIKDNKDNYEPELVAIAGFCATYNAKWFGGYAGIVQTKIGTIRNYYDEAVRNILKQSEELSGVIFMNKDYKDFLGVKGTLVYCDPPYQGVTKYGNNDFDHESFWDWIREMSKDNIVLVSEYNAPDDFKAIYQKGLETTLDKNSRKIAVEKLFVLK